MTDKHKFSISAHRLIEMSNALSSWTVQWLRKWYFDMCQKRTQLFKLTFYFSFTTLITPKYDAVYWMAFLNNFSCTQNEHKGFSFKLGLLNMEIWCLKIWKSDDESEIHWTSILIMKTHAYDRGNKKSWSEKNMVHKFQCDIAIFFSDRWRKKNFNYITICMYVLHEWLRSKRNTDVRAKWEYLGLSRR